MESNRQQPDVSVKGYYYNLEKSPYEWKSPYGDSYKLPSAKRLEMMEKQSAEAARRLDKLIDAYDLRKYMQPELLVLLNKHVFNAVYDGIVKR